MKNAPPTLNQIQQWMQAVITHPHGVQHGISSDAACDQINVTNENVEAVITRSRALTSVERLNVYAEAYFARLLECLAEEFPAMVHAVGEEAFNGLAMGYLQDCPPRSYTLCDLGSRFPDYLETTRPPREPANEIDWVDFLIDLARLQRTYSDVFDGPGFEGQKLLKTEDLVSISADQWDSVRFQTVPCLRVETYRFPVHVYASDVRLDKEPEMAVAAETLLAISRIQYRVRRWELSRAQYELLENLIAGKTLGDAITAAVSHGETDMNDIATQLREWFTEWAESGFFAVILSE